MPTSTSQLRQPRLLSRDHLICHGPDLIERQGRGCQRIEHERVIDGISVTVDAGVDCQALHVDHGLVERRKLGWEVADHRWLNP